MFLLLPCALQSSACDLHGQQTPRLLAETHPAPDMPQVKTIDGIDTVFQPLALQSNTEVSILPVEDGDLACSLENPKTRFRPFGYKEMTSNPPQDKLEKPARVYWQIPERFKSLDQLKFLTLPSKGRPGPYSWPISLPLQPSLPFLPTCLVQPAN